METNKVEAFGKVLIDLTNDTVTPSAMVQGVTAHDRSGAIIEGELDWDSKQDVIDDLDTIRDNSELATWIVPGGVVKEYTSDMQAKPGDCIAYNGAVWRSLGWSMGWTPGDPSGKEPRMWEKISLTTLGNKTDNLITTDGTHTNDTRLAIDPNAQELEFVTSDEVDALSQKIDNVMLSSSNPNLIDNWYFGNPVNQRGQTQYTSSESGIFTIDRWKLSGAGNIVGTPPIHHILYLKATTAGPFPLFYQSLDQNLVKYLAGRKVTLSIMAGAVSGNFSLSDSGGLSKDHRDVQIHNGLTSYTFEVSEDARDCGVFIWSNAANSSMYISAMKLELGETQTLAHMENGNLVLNEVPNYEEQLRRCQRYFYKYEGYHDLYLADPANNFYRGVIVFPVTMHDVPSVSGDLSANMSYNVYKDHIFMVSNGSIAAIGSRGATFTVPGLGG